MSRPVPEGYRRCPSEITLPIRGIPSPPPIELTAELCRERAYDECAERRFEDEAETEDEIEPELIVEAAAAEPVDRIDGGFTCDLIECKDPCSEVMRGELW